jgi:hypothetical protein
VLEVLRAIERGEVHVLNPLCDLPDCHGEFRLSNGWEISVFIDAGDWDYVEWARSPQGAEWSCEAYDDEKIWPSELREFRPSDRSITHNYGILDDDPWSVGIDPQSGLHRARSRPPGSS